jgi:NOL1/NOP2/sun family putative RNA methylase
MPSKPPPAAAQPRDLEVWAAKLARAVLDKLNYLERSPQAAAVRRLASSYGITLSQAARLVELFGSVDEAEEFLSTSSSHVLRTIRVNTLRASPSYVRRRLEMKGFKLRPYEPTPYGLVVEEEPIPIGATHEYMLGYYTIQGPASMLVVVALSPKHNARLAVDACAGAGGKTTQLAQHVRGVIVAVDINPRKLLALKNHLSRLGVFNVVAIKADARDLPGIVHGYEYAVVDAPCSGEGLWPYPWGRKPRRPADIASRVELQLQILASVVKGLSRGGELVYATCSISVEENEYVVSKTIELFEDLRVAPISIPGEPGVDDYMGYNLNPQVKMCRRLYPHKHSTEGFTICKLVRES